MGIIPFYYTEDLSSVRELYGSILQLPLAKDQGSCLIFQIDSDSGIGFCTHMQPVTPKKNLFITLVVDDIYPYYEKLLKAHYKCLKEPTINEKFKINQVLFEDCNGYTLEIQTFL